MESEAKSVMGSGWRVEQLEEKLKTEIETKGLGNSASRAAVRCTSKMVLSYTVVGAHQEIEKRVGEQFQIANNVAIVLLLVVGLVTLFQTKDKNKCLQSSLGYFVGLVSSVWIYL